MTYSPPDTHELLNRAARGDRTAVSRLLQGYRARLKKMVALRLDPRLAARADPSDIVQEALVEAHHKLPNYLAQRPIAFYPWLRALALEQMIRFTRRHLKVRARSVMREVPPEPHLSDASAELLANRLVDRGSRPENRLERSESHRAMKAALAQLPAEYREVLVLKFLEELSTDEVAEVLGTTASAVRSRQLRALQRIKADLQN